MTQPINPNTNIQMSLQVEKIQQIRNTHNAQQQGQLAQQSAVEEKIQKQRVNSNNEADQARIKEREQRNREQKQDKRDEEEKNQGSKEEIKDNSKLTNRQIGKYIDIKV